MRSLIGKKAPAIKATAVVDGNRIENGFSLDRYEGQKYVVLFFYPMDFTFVCPTELHAFQEKLPEFEARNVQVVGCSVDSEYSHLAWLNQPKNKGGIQGVTYPIIADTTKTISENYGVLGEKDVLVNGHFHVPAFERREKHLYVNCGSVSIPKENSPHSCLVLQDGALLWKDVETGEIFRRETL